MYPAERSEQIGTLWDTPVIFMPPVPLPQDLNRGFGSKKALPGEFLLLLRRGCEVPSFQQIFTPYQPSFHGIFWGHTFC